MAGQRQLQLKGQPCPCHKPDCRHANSRHLVKAGSDQFPSAAASSTGCPCPICFPHILFLPTSLKCSSSTLHKSISAHHSIRIGPGILVLIQNDNSGLDFQGKNNVGFFQVPFQVQSFMGSPEWLLPLMPAGRRLPPRCNPNCDCQQQPLPRRGAVADEDGCCVVITGNKK